MTPAVSLTDFDPGNAQSHGQPWLSAPETGRYPSNITANGDGKAEVEVEVPCLDVVQDRLSGSGSFHNHFSGPDNFRQVARSENRLRENLCHYS